MADPALPPPPTKEALTQLRDRTDAVHSAIELAREIARHVRTLFRQAAPLLDELGECEDLAGFFTSLDHAADRINLVVEQLRAAERDVWQVGNRLDDAIGKLDDIDPPADQP
jgi:hypothetical protein